MPANGKPFDDVFKTLLEKCRKLIIPVINEVFGTDYLMEENTLLLSNEFHYVSKDGDTVYRIADSCLKIRNKLYHIECQSNADSSIEIRMIEYDFLIALSNAEKKDSELVLNFPDSAVLYLRHNKNTPDFLTVRMLLQDGSTTSYSIPVVKVQNYSKNEIFDKQLLFFIPYYILKFEDKIETIAMDEAESKKFTAEYMDIYQRLKDLEKKNVIDVDYLYKLVELTGRLVDVVAGNAENLKSEVAIMGGEVLRLKSDEIFEAGISKGISQGLDQGVSQGEFLKIISQIRKKLMKHKSVEIISEELEEDADLVEKIVKVIQENNTATDTEVFKKIQ